MTAAAVVVDTITGVAGTTGTAGDRLKVGAPMSGWAIYNMPAQFADVRYYNEAVDATHASLHALDLRCQAMGHLAGTDTRV